MSFSDARVVQYASAGMILSGLLVTAGASALFPLRVSLSKVTALNPIPWAPRGLWGTGQHGKSPIFGLMWFLIYTGEVVYAVALATAAALGDVEMDASMMFNHASCVFAGLLMSSLWTPLFAENKRWCLLLATLILVATACVTLTGAILAKPFLTTRWFEDFGGVFTSIFAGWVTTAAALSVGTLTRVYNRGINKGAQNDEETSLFPVVLSVFLSTLAIAFANPVLPVPLFVALFFVKGIFKDWHVWGASLLCLLGIAVGTAMVFVYRAIGVFW